MIKDFRDLSLADIFLDADPQKKPEWGRMNLHQMVEHLSDVIQYSNGRKLFTPTENAADASKAKYFLHSTDEFPKDFRSPFPKNQDSMYKIPYFENAVMDLMVNVSHFDIFYERYPTQTPFHPYFGNLSKQEWILFHNKHFAHHFKQFDISPK